MTAGTGTATRAKIAHELRTRLNAIIGFAEILARGMAPDAAKQVEYAGEILTSARDLLHLIDQFVLEFGPAPTDGTAPSNHGATITREGGGST